MRPPRNIISRVGLQPVVLVAAVLRALPESAAGVTFGFGCVTRSNEADCRIGEAQLELELSDPVPGDGQIRLRIANALGAASAVSAVYLDDGILQGLAVVPTPGVQLTVGSASPPNLPGGNLLDPPFAATANLVADADPPPSMNGVNPGEELLIDATLVAGFGLSDVARRIQDGTLRVGVHVTAYAPGGSESFVTLWCPPPPPTVSDFVFVVDSSLTMRRDLGSWLPPQLGVFPDDLDAEGIDWRIAVVRFGTNRQPDKPRRGPQLPDVVQPFSASPREPAPAATAAAARRAGCRIKRGSTPWRRAWCETASSSA